MTLITVYTTKEIADAIGVASSTILNWARKHKIGRRVERTWFFTPFDLEKLRKVGEK